jgi:hypothetical protein
VENYWLFIGATSATTLWLSLYTGNAIASLVLNIRSKICSIRKSLIKYKNHDSVKKQAKAAIGLRVPITHFKIHTTKQ